MKTNQQFDDAWRRLQRARRIEALEELIDAVEALLHAARMMRLDQKQHDEENKPEAVNPYDGPIKYK